MVPVTLVVLSTIGTPFVLMVTIGRLIAEAAGVNEGLEMEMVSESWAVVCAELEVP